MLSRQTLAMWLSPMVPLMAVDRVCTALGRPLTLLELMSPRMMLGDHVPRALSRHRFTGDEVFIATYGKSGTNWAMQIAIQTAYRGAAEFGHIHDLVPWPDGPIPGVVSLAEASTRRRAPTGRLVIKTHLRADLLPYDPRAAYITVIRDPKEVAVSAYHFFRGVFGVRELVGFDEWYSRFIHEAPLLEGWATHTASYWAWRERPKVLVLTYPKMKADLPGCARRFAELMEVSLTEAEHEEVVRRSGFAYMKAHNARFSPPIAPLRRREPPAEMIRRGTAGGSGELLSPDRQRAIDQWCERRLRELGSDFPYAELFDRQRDSGS